MEGVLARYHLSDASEKIRASGELCNIIATYTSSVEREVYLTAVAKSLELPVDALRNDVARILKKRMGEFRAQQKRTAEAEIKRFGDRVNPDAAKDPRAANAEESVLGLLLLFEEYRTAVERGDIALSSEDFMTEFHRRVFDAVMQRHAAEGSFDVALLEAEFTPDEAGRIRAMMIRREQLTQNTVEVFRSSVATLREERTKKSLAEGDIHSTLAYLRDKKRIHKGKVDTE
jgi:DNA primase